MMMGATHIVNKAVSSALCHGATGHCNNNKVAAVEVPTIKKKKKEEEEFSPTTTTKSCCSKGQCHSQRAESTVVSCKSNGEGQCPQPCSSSGDSTETLPKSNPSCCATGTCRTTLDATTTTTTTSSSSSVHAVKSTGCTTTGKCIGNSRKAITVEKSLSSSSSSNNNNNKCCSSKEICGDKSVANESTSSVCCSSMTCGNHKTVSNVAGGVVNPAIHQKQSFLDHKQEEQEESVITGEQNKKTFTGRSSFYVANICCASEIPAINSIVHPMNGTRKVSLNVTTKMVREEEEEEEKRHTRTKINIGTLCVFSWGGGHRLFSLCSNPMSHVGCVDTHISLYRYTSTMTLDLFRRMPFVMHSTRKGLMHVLNPMPEQRQVACPRL